MPSDLMPAKLIRLAETTLREPDRYQEFFSEVCRLLAGAHYRVLNQAYRQIRAPETWRTFDDCVKAAASRWESALSGTQACHSLAVFAIPISLLLPAGTAWAEELSQVTIQALQAGMEHFEVISNVGQMILSPQLVRRSFLKCATVAERHRLTQRICRHVARTGRLPTFQGRPDLAGQRVHVSELYLLGVAGGNVPGGRPLFYQASAEQLMQWTQLCSAQLQIALARVGRVAEVEAGPPDLIYYALDFGAYRSHLIEMEAQIASQLDRIGMHPSENVAVISRHPDRYIRISLFDTGARMQRFLFCWAERPFEDAPMVLQDLELMLQDLGFADIRVIPGLQYAAPGCYGIIPTLEDMEHNRPLQ